MHFFPHNMAGMGLVFTEALFLHIYIQKRQKSRWIVSLINLIHCSDIHFLQHDRNGDGTGEKSHWIVSFNTFFRMHFFYNIAGKSLVLTEALHLHIYIDGKGKILV
jgi:hypothetical protein